MCGTLYLQMVLLLQTFTSSCSELTYQNFGILTGDMYMTLFTFSVFIKLKLKFKTWKYLNPVVFAILPNRF